jgi:hypothetical protein
MSIPRQIHMTWVDRDIFDHQNPMIMNGLRNVRDLNPDWTVNIYLDHEVDEYIRQHIGIRDYALLQQRPFVERSDIWRLLKLYNEGGMYLDLDRYYNIPMSQIVEPGIKCLLPTDGDYDFSQDIMCSEPGNPIYQRVIELNLKRRYSGITHTYYLGSQTYMHGITQELMGYMIDVDPGPEIFEKIRQQLSYHSFIKTYKESLPNDTIVFKFDPNTFQLGNGQSKLDFYQEFNVVHWEQQ